MIPAGLLPEVIAVAPDGSGSPTRQKSDADAELWQREFERARLSGWLTMTPTRDQAPALADLPGLFHANAVAAGAFVASPPTRADAQLQMQSLLVQLGMLAEGQVTIDVARPQEQAAPGAGQQAGGEPRSASELQRFRWNAASSSWLADAAQPLKLPAPATDKPAAAAATRTQAPFATEPQAPQPPVRLHAEWTADGVRLWLALDATVQHQLAAITQQVRRWMFAQGVQVIEFSCNGRPLDPAAHTEEPWPSAP